MWKKPLLFKLACKFVDWLIATFGQTKPWELVRLPKDGHAYYDCQHCGGKGNVKVVHHQHNTPNYFLKGDLSYWLIKRGRAGLKTDNRIHPDADVAKNKEQQWREPWRGEVLKQFKRWVDYLGLPLIPTPSGGYQTEYPKHWNQEVKSSNLYFNGKATNYEYLHFGENKAQGAYVVHPLSKDRLPELTEEFLLNWNKQQKRTKRFKYFSQKLITESAAKFGIYFTKQPPKKEKAKQPIIRDTRNDLTNTAISVLSHRHLSEQKTTDYDPWQINFLTEPFGEKKHLILNATHPYQKQLLVKFLKNNGSLFHFNLLQLSLDCHLQRWKEKLDEKKPTQPFLTPIIPQKKEGDRWTVKVKKSAYGKMIDNFQQVIYTGEDDQDYSVLFNCESKLVKENFLDNKVGNFASTFFLKAGHSGAFIQPRAF